MKKEAVGQGTVSLFFTPVLCVGYFVKEQKDNAFNDLSKIRFSANGLEVLFDFPQINWTVGREGELRVSFLENYSKNLPLWNILEGGYATRCQKKRLSHLFLSLHVGVSTILT